ncbi:MAG: hypothetical protein M3Q84_09170, partial [Actinomycetota bacterium]|nr:hypothetical protein [Actinomycetota bacterium]
MRGSPSADLVSSSEVVPSVAEAPAIDSSGVESDAVVWSAPVGSSWPVGLGERGSPSTPAEVPPRVRRRVRGVRVRGGRSSAAVSDPRERLSRLEP